jgi:hypothetical protein
MATSRRLKWIHIESKGNLRSVYKIMVGKPVGKRQLAMHRRLREDNIKIDLIEMVVAMWT